MGSKLEKGSEPSTFSPNGTGHGFISGHRKLFRQFKISLVTSDSYILYLS